MKTLIEHFQEHWSKLNLSPDKKLLIAVSGGIDSMVLCDLCLKLNLQFSLAHCKFQLRAEASDLDQKFFENYVVLYNKRLIDELLVSVLCKLMQCNLYYI